MTPFEAFVWGFGGSVAIEILVVARYFAPRKRKLPARYSDRYYYVLRFAIAVISGCVAIAHNPTQPWTAIQLGITAPLLLMAFGKVEKEHRRNNPANVTKRKLQVRSGGRATSSED